MGRRVVAVVSALVLGAGLVVADLRPLPPVERICNQYECAAAVNEICVSDFGRPGASRSDLGYSNGSLWCLGECGSGEFVVIESDCDNIAGGD